MKHVAVVFALVCLAAHACWKDIPLPELVQKRQLIVVGEIVRIEAAPAPKNDEHYQYDIAFIKVDKVLLNTLPDFEVKPAQEIALSMPATVNRMRISTDLRYKLGTKGVWLLDLRDKSLWATYPKDLQPLASEPEIAALIQKRK